MPSPDQERHNQERQSQERMDALSEAIVRLIHRFDAMDERLAHLEAAAGLPQARSPVPPSPPLPEPAPATEAEPAEPPPVPGSAPPEPEAEPELVPAALASSPQEHSPEYGRQAMETRMGLTLVNRIGVVTLILGVGFFFKYAVDNQWIGPMGRVALGVLAGLVTLVAGGWLWTRGQRIFAQGVTGLGIALLYLSFYASFGFYHLVPQEAAFVLMVVNTVAAGALALRYDALAIAALGLVGGYLTPVLLSTGQDAPWVLFSYILLLNIGAVAVASRKRWRLLDLVAFIATALLYTTWYESWFQPEKRLVATVFALAYYAVFATRRSRFLLAAVQALGALAVAAVWKDQASGYAPLQIGLVLSGLVLADRRGWTDGVTSSFLSFWLAYFLWSPERPVGGLFGFLTAAMLIFAAWAPWWVIQRREKARVQDLLVLALNPLAYFTACYVLLYPAYKDYFGLFAVAVAALHLAIGYSLWRVEKAAGRDGTPAMLAVGVALVFLTLATPLQLSAYRITIAWAIEGAALAWIGARVRQVRLEWASWAVFVLVLARLYALDAWIYPDVHAYRALFNARFLTFALAAVSYWLGAYWCTSRRGALVTYIAGHVLMLWGCGMEVLGWAGRTAAPESLASVETTSVSILMALYALVLVSIGVATRSVLNRILGLGLMGVVVLKLYLLDVWQLSRLFRTVAFVGLGVLLLATSYLYSRFRTTIEKWWRNEHAG